MKFGKRRRSLPPSVEEMSLDPRPSDIYILGNGPSLNRISPEMLEGFFTIGTNRSWLWGPTNILLWRDPRITEELAFFETEKDATLWVASADKSFESEMTGDVVGKVDYVFTDSWKDNILGKGIRWNGVVFHALAVALHLSPEARIHLAGIDLLNSPGSHHFFSDFPGFNQGFYKTSWDESNFHFQKRLDMMMNNFRRLKERGLRFVNHSENSRLTELFGYEKPG